MRTKAVVSRVGVFVLCTVFAAGPALLGGIARAAEGMEAQPAPDTTQQAPAQAPVAGKYDFSELKATQAAEQAESLGALYKEIERSNDPERYKFKVELTSRGAGIQQVTLSEFGNREREEEPLVLLSPETGTLPATLANGYFALAGSGSRFPLQKLNWEMLKKSVEEGQESLAFQATLRDAGGKDAVRLTKTFHVFSGQYGLECELVVENLTDVPLEATLQMEGPVGIDREGIRSDMRRVVAAYMVNEHIESLSKEYGKLQKADRDNALDQVRLKPRNPAAKFVWAAVANKYFAAIMRPVPREGLTPEGVALGPLQFADPDPAGRQPGERATAGLTLDISELKLAPAGQEGASATRTFDLYVGPKERHVFDGNPVYRELGYEQTIVFSSCCCPSSVIAPLAFGIIAIMNWMYKAMGPFGNYGVVIMILVFVVRLALHPITKKSQVSMMRMQKLAPRMEEIKQKYANNKAELNKRMMELYREQGASPVLGFLPMLLQMPIWIALWTAVYTSIDLRGAPFLPFWITDLSAPDALFYFPKPITIPLLGTIDSFNLLPILMGVVMYLQQKLMPTSSAAQTNPQMAQQQKIMMIMFPLLFPIMLYKGPSGVNLYIMSSIAGGVVEQMVIRKHIREKEDQESLGRVPVTKKTGGKVKKKKPKPFFKT